MAKRAKKKTARKKATGKAGRKKATRTAPRGRPAARGAGTSLRSADTAALQRELDRRQGALAARREELVAELEDIDAQLAATNGSAGGPSGPGGGRKRHKNKQTLEDALAGVLAGRTMGPTEAAEAVQTAGYRSTASNFRTIVNQTLTRSDRIKKVASGQYTAKG